MAAAIAAFYLALPDRSARWALLPAPFALFGVSDLGFGCVAEFVTQGWPAISTRFGCMRFILGFGLPLTLAMLWMTRHAAPVRPAPVAALAGLAARSRGAKATRVIGPQGTCIGAPAWRRLR